MVVIAFLAGQPIAEWLILTRSAVFAITPWLETALVSILYATPDRLWLDVDPLELHVHWRVLPGLYLERVIRGLNQSGCLA